MIFDFRNLDGAQRAAADAALGKCDFPWDRLVQGLRGQTGKETIPVEMHPPSEMPNAGGYAWWDGRIWINSAHSGSDLGYIFLVESAHMVDFFYLTDPQRRAIYDVLHAAGHDTHTWWGGSYWDTVGEAFMQGFTAGYAPVYHREDDRFGGHSVSIEEGKRIRLIVTPDMPPPNPPPPRPDHHHHGHNHPHKRGRDHHHPHFRHAQNHHHHPHRHV